MILESKLNVEFIQISNEKRKWHNYVYCILYSVHDYTLFICADTDIICGILTI